MLRSEGLFGGVCVASASIFYWLNCLPRHEIFFLSRMTSLRSKNTFIELNYHLFTLKINSSHTIDSDHDFPSLNLSQIFPPPYLPNSMLSFSVSLENLFSKSKDMRNTYTLTHTQKNPTKSETIYICKIRNSKVKEKAILDKKVSKDVTGFILCWR